MTLVEPLGEPCGLRARAHLHSPWCPLPWPRPQPILVACAFFFLGVCRRAWRVTFPRTCVHHFFSRPAFLALVISRAACIFRFPPWTGTCVYSLLFVLLSPTAQSCDSAAVALLSLSSVAAMALIHVFPWSMLMHSVSYAICMSGIHVLISQACVDFKHTSPGVSIERRAALPSTIRGYALRPPEHCCTADATVCTGYLQPCQDARRAPPVLTASGPNCFRRLAAHVGPNKSSADKDTNRSVSQHRHVKCSDAHSEHSTPRRPRVQRPKLLPGRIRGGHLLQLLPKVRRQP